MLTGRTGINEYTESIIASPRIRNLMQRVAYVVDADLAPRGDPANPLNDKELDDKLHRLLSGSISPDMESASIAALASLGEEGMLRAVFASAGWS